ncbi:hypothetical protein C8J56DRAFT_1172674 [Mycena floridula]|nr:hypothetical protein C8J56DRAFT_1172674 [Mycena floridula]
MKFIFAALPFMLCSAVWANIEAVTDSGESAKIATDGACILLTAPATSATAPDHSCKVYQNANCSDRPTGLRKPPPGRVMIKKKTGPSVACYRQRQPQSGKPTGFRQPGQSAAKSLSDQSL